VLKSQISLELNMGVQRGLNEDEIVPMAKLARDHSIEVRFIEQMISVDQAVQLLRQNFTQRRVETFDLEEATGRALAEDLTAVEPTPRFTDSAMDGFAVRFSDLKQLPVRLQIAGKAGQAFRLKKRYRPVRRYALALARFCRKVPIPWCRLKIVKLTSSRSRF